MESSSKCSGLNSLLRTAQRIGEENTQQKDDSTIVESGLGKTGFSRLRFLKRVINVRTGHPIRLKMTKLLMKGKTLEIGTTGFLEG